MDIYLTSKSVLRLSGKARSFLMGMSSNVPEAPHNCFLDKNGKMVAVFDQHLLSEDQALIVVESDCVQRLRDHLSVYLSLNESLLEDAPLKVYYVTSAAKNVFADAVRIPQAHGELLITDENLPVNASEEWYTNLRLEHHMPLQGRDYDREMLLNVHGTTHVSFDKGCYLGQEIIARVHYKSKPPQKLIVQYLEECDPKRQKSMTSLSPHPDTGRMRGFVFVNN